SSTASSPPPSTEHCLFAPPLSSTLPPPPTPTPFPYTTLFRSGNHPLPQTAHTVFSPFSTTPFSCFSYYTGFPGKRKPPYRVCARSEEHTSELQSRFDLVCRLLLENKNSIIASGFVISVLIVTL